MGWLVLVNTYDQTSLYCKDAAGEKREKKTTRCTRWVGKMDATLSIKINTFLQT